MIPHDQLSICGEIVLSSSADAAVEALAMTILQPLM
jgi:hypothetical protein